MDAAENNTTRKELINWISELKDTRLLQHINSIRLSKVEEGDDWWDSISDIEKENIRLGLKDIEEGRVLSSKEFWKQLKNG